MLSAPTVAAMVDASLTMTGPPLRLLRGVVSQGHKRYSADGFDLDLTYVLPRVIALGLPAGSPATGTWTGLLEPLWRNPLGEVRSLLDQYHSKSYLMINLCNERDYADADWPGAARVVRFPFDDHHPPALAAMQKLCELVEQFLSEDESRVVRRAIRPRNSGIFLPTPRSLALSGGDPLQGWRRPHRSDGVRLPAVERPPGVHRC